MSLAGFRIGDLDAPNELYAIAYIRADFWAFIYMRVPMGLLYRRPGYVVTPLNDLVSQGPG